MSDAAATQVELVVVAAVAENGVIGDDDAIPWHYPEDLAHFKETTMGHPVIMGRRTYESIAARIGGPLPGRTNVVLTRSGLDAGSGADESDAVLEAASLDAAVTAAAETGADTAYVAGGATIYEQLLDRADRLVITEIPGEPDGDTRFPEWDRDAWTEIDRREEGDLAFVTYERIDAETD